MKQEKPDFLCIMLLGSLPCVAIGDMDLTLTCALVQYGFRGLGHVGAWWHRR